MNYSKTSISSDNIDAYLWEVRHSLQWKHDKTLPEADNLLYPLTWYINTGRASCEFLHKMVEAKPFMIARKLAEGGAIQDAIDRVKAYLKYAPC